MPTPSELFLTHPNASSCETQKWGSRCPRRCVRPRVTANFTVICFSGEVFSSLNLRARFWVWQLLLNISVADKLHSQSNPQKVPQWQPFHIPSCHTPKTRSGLLTSMRPCSSPVALPWSVSFGSPRYHSQRLSPSRPRFTTGSCFSGQRRFGCLVCEIISRSSH